MSCGTRQGSPVMAGRRLAAIVVCAVVAPALGCFGSRSPSVTVGQTTFALDALLAARPMADAAAIRSDELGRTQGSSVHLVQARGPETPHRHLRHDLAVMVVRGRGTLHVAERAHALAAGDVVLVPRGTPHWFEPRGPRTAVAIVIFAPPFDGADSEPVPAEP